MAAKQDPERDRRPSRTVRFWPSQTWDEVQYALGSFVQVQDLGLAALNASWWAGYVSRQRKTQRFKGWPWHKVEAELWIERAPLNLSPQLVKAEVAKLCEQKWASIDDRAGLLSICATTSYNAQVMETEFRNHLRKYNGLIAQKCGFKLGDKMICLYCFQPMPLGKERGRRTVMCSTDCQHVGMKIPSGRPNGIGKRPKGGAATRK